MNTPAIPQGQREVTLVKKGFWYYIFKILTAPFRMIYWCFLHWIKAPFSELSVMHKENEKIRKKNNHLRALIIKRYDNEVL